jgi:hypothetical protein
MHFAWTWVRGGGCLEGLGVGLGLAGGGVGGVVAEAAVRLAKTVADTATQVGCKHNIDNSSTIRVPVPGHMCHRPRDDADLILISLFM